LSFLQVEEKSTGAETAPPKLSAAISQGGSGNALFSMFSSSEIVVHFLHGNTEDVEDW
jgi:hypothetical protein